MPVLSQVSRGANLHATTPDIGAQYYFIDVTLVCEDDNSELVDVVTVADVDDEDHVGNSLLQMLKLRFGHKA